jgi:hypothetical protein
VTHFDALLPSRTHGEVFNATSALVALGIKHANSHDLPKSDYRLFIAPGAVGYTSADLVAEAIERQASDPGNQRKLDGKAPRRHLLVTPTLSGGDTGFAVFELADMLRGADAALRMASSTNARRILRSLHRVARRRSRHPPLRARPARMLAAPTDLLGGA